MADQLDMFGDDTLLTSSKSPAVLINEVAASALRPVPANDAVPVADLIADFPPDVAVPLAADILAANDTASRSLEIDAQVEVVRTKLPIYQAGTLQIWLDDEWWTTAMVCAYLKLGRKAIWERQRDDRYHFPKPFHFGSMRQRWKSEEVRAWASERQ